MKIFINEIRNDWDDRTLSDAMTWANDHRDNDRTRKEAEELLSHYLRLNPADAGRLYIHSYEIEVEA